MMFNLLTTRKPLSSLAVSVEELGKICKGFKAVAENEKQDFQRASVVPSIQFNLEQMKQMAYYMVKLLDYSVEVATSVSSLYKPVETEVFSSAKTFCERMLVELPEIHHLVFTNSEVELVNEFKMFLEKFSGDLRLWKAKNPQLAFIADVVLTWISQWEYCPFINSSTTVEKLSLVEDVEKCMREASNSILVSVQNVLELVKDDITDETDEWLALSQQRLSRSIKQLHLKQIIRRLENSMDHILKIEQNSQSSKLISALVAFTMPMLIQYQALVIKILSQAKNSYVEMAKLPFALTKSLLTLANDGFCSPEPPNEQKQDNNLAGRNGFR
ncbi:hypothetical protein CLUG_04816 [Clavispora lusitaniae ATCC 42720]|uniref:Uncharacterized protein n=1 Tax=Clavispora lusitaniae (strain ATCC 42720) TaxID=306902 RepID=C4Y9D8_CLAL4|nr:uncharacterized protein CLUG_04816 [Clavispora lusitaniae ATCC 42720]EEQ40688.1 hypothetical protein CLUG_04816 [Clavispora lusitaniae ATCC 42720]